MSLPLIWVLLSSTMAPVDLRCQVAAHPLGRDPAPSFSWSFKSPERGQMQTAYRILVASDPEDLQKGRGSKWDSGIVRSDQRLLSEIAGVLGKRDDAESFSRLASAVRDAFDARFWDEAAGAYGDGSQTTCILPLAFGMVPAGKTARVVERLKSDVEDRDGHLDTGIFGTRYLLDVLADHGLVDLGCKILLQETYPSFGDQIRQGATTAWEQWRARGPMHSHNHAMFGGLGVSFYTRLGGIRPLQAGYREILIEPAIPAELDYVVSSIQTIRGFVSSSWKKEGDALRLEVDVPPNSRARLRLPRGAGEAFEILERGRPVWSQDRFLPGAAGIHAGRTAGGGVELELGSGSYSFLCKPFGA